MKCLHFVFLFALLFPSNSRADELPHVNGVSRFLKDLVIGEYKEIAQPEQASVFRWDFSKKSLYRYSYEQKSRSKMDFGFDRETDNDVSGLQGSTKGVMSVESQGDGTANVVYSDIKNSMDITFGEENRGPSTAKLPAKVILGMKEDGSGAFEYNSFEFQHLFPLPSKILKVGESVDLPSQMPFNAMGSMLQVTGRCRVTLARYVKIEERVCAQLDVDVAIEDVKVPSQLELDGEFKFSMKGSGIFYFDLANQSFVSGSIALLSLMNVDAPAAQTSLPERIKVPKDVKESIKDLMPTRTKISTISDYFIQYRKID